MLFFHPCRRGRKTANFNVIIGEKFSGREKALSTRPAPLRSIISLTGSHGKNLRGPLSRNFPAIFSYKAQG